MNPPVRQSNSHIVWPTSFQAGVDFKPQYVCALVFVAVRVAGIIGASLSVPAGTRSLVTSHHHVAVVFGLLIALYLGIAAGLARGKLSALVKHRWVIAVDFGLVALVNVWTSTIAPQRQIDIGGNDLFWMAAIGSIALWGAVHGRTVAVMMMSAGVALLVAMSYANGFTFDNLNWAFIMSRIVFAGIGLIATTSGLRISERFEEFRRIQGQRAGEQQALGAMHRRALQDLKIIDRLASEDGSPDDRLQEIKRHATALAEYVRTWPEQHQEPRDIHDAIRSAVAEVDPMGSTTVDTAHLAQQLAAQSQVDISTDVLAAVQEAVGEAVANAMQHASVGPLRQLQSEPATVTATIEQQRLFIDISDSGCGFEGSVEDSLTSSLRPGTGLGLTRIVDVMQAVGGTAILTTAPGQGATWTLSIDVAEGDDSDSKPTERDHRLAS